MGSSQAQNPRGNVDSAIPTPSLAVAALALALAASTLALFATPALAASQTLKIAVTGQGSVDASEGAIAACEERQGTCEGEYAEATTVLLTALPAAYSHVTWTGCAPKADEDECEVMIGASDAEVKADFAPNLHTLTVLPAGEGSIHADSGAISGCSEAAGACSGQYAEATTVTLFALPSPHHAVAWSGCTAQPTEEVCEVEVPAQDAEVTATFSLLTHPLYIAEAGTGSGQVSCNGSPCAASYPGGTELTIAAIPAAGSTFAGWSGEACSGTGACDLTLEATTALTATFTANPPPPAEEEKKPPLKCHKGFVKKNGRCVHKSKPHHMKRH